MMIYLIRHGETTADIEHRYGGAYNDHLTARGRSQAIELGQTLINKNIDALFYSPYFRTTEAATIVQQYISCPATAVAEFRERDHFGALSGLTLSEAATQYPEEVKLLSDYRNTLPHSESYDSLCARVLPAFNAIIIKPFASVAIITHGGPIRCILRELLSIEIPRLLQDCEIITLQKNNSSLTIC